MKTKENKNPKRKKLFMLLGIGLGVLAIGGGFSYWYFKGRKSSSTKDSEFDFLPPVKDEVKTVPKTNPSTPKAPAPKTTPVSPVNPPPKVGVFPLKSGSKNALVKQVQDALIQKYGKTILPKYGADGQFGKEMTTALTSKGFPVIVDEITFNKIIGLNTPVPPVASGALSPSQTQQVEIAKNIWLYTSTKKLTSLLEQLKRITNVAAYVSVNELFKTVRLNGVRQTIVNATLSIFTDDTSKQLIRAEFLRIGLKYDGTKWSLAGIRQKQIITNRGTTICSLKGIELDVPAQTILGIEIGRLKRNTRFRTLDNQILTVPTNHINYV